MKTIGIINGPISAVIAHLEHTDTLMIADAGLPTPDPTPRIDLALKPGMPGFLETLDVVLQEMFVEKAYRWIVSSSSAARARCRRMPL